MRTILRLAGAELLSAGAFLALWLAPARFGVDATTPSTIGDIIFFECLVLFAAIPLAEALAASERDRAVAGLMLGAALLLVGPFMIAYALGQNAPWVLMAFAWLMGSKVFSLFWNHRDARVSATAAPAEYLRRPQPISPLTGERVLRVAGRTMAVGSVGLAMFPLSVLGVLLITGPYLQDRFTGPGLWLQQLPALGLTPEFLQQQGLPADDLSLLRALAFATYFFLAQALLRLLIPPIAAALSDD